MVNEYKVDIGFLCIGVFKIVDINVVFVVNWFGVVVLMF